MILKIAIILKMALSPTGPKCRLQNSADTVSALLWGQHLGPVGLKTMIKMIVTLKIIKNPDFGLLELLL